MTETALEKWDRGKTLLLESLFKPDSRLRGCAYNQNCYDEMMELRDTVIELVKEMKNPHSPSMPFGKKNNHIEPTVTTPNGQISETLMSGSLGNYYNKEIEET
tara:strand:+ start:363 stop:671 length:309 start_codon:yes stop_codon:yes gene_type:complete